MLNKKLALFLYDEIDKIYMEELKELLKKELSP